MIADISDTGDSGACAVGIDLIAAQNASRTAAEYRIPVCPPPAFQPAARANFLPVVAGTPPPWPPPPQPTSAPWNLLAPTQGTSLLP